MVYDLAEFVEESIGSVRVSSSSGPFLRRSSSFCFCEISEATLVAATSLPLSVIGTFFFLKLFGGTLNLMSLGGLAIAIGLIIDDAVVIIENIYRHIGLGESPIEAADNGTQELLTPVIGSTATTVVVFLPLSLLTGWVGDLFTALCLTLGVSILLSLVFAVALIPLLSVNFLSTATHRDKSARFIEPVNRVYERMVRWSLRHRLIVAGTAIVSLGLGVFLYTHLETGLLPDMDEGGYVLDSRTPAGTSLDQTNHFEEQLEQRIAQMPETDTFSRRTGAEMGLFVTEQNKSDILIKLKPRADRKRTTEEVLEDMRAWTKEHVPALDVEFHPILQDMLGDLEGTPEPVEVKLFGSDMKTLETVADDASARIQKIKGIVDFKGIQKGNPEIVFHVNSVLAGRPWSWAWIR